MKKSIKILLIIIIVIAVLVAAAAIVFSSLEKKSAAMFEQLVEEGPPYVDMSVIADGKFKGAYNVFPIDVEVSVLVSGGSIVEIEILKHVTGQGKSAESIVNDVIREQTLSVDTVSGATYSSLVILKAVEDALVH